MWRITPLLILITLGLASILAGSTLAANNNYRIPSALHPSSLIPHPSTEGARLYRQWCSTCHGDRGQGLTESWRAEWPEGKQNCWQSKCHATNHPPDGFSFPKNVPALIGQNTLTKFTTAQDLYAYSQATMPYWSPDLLKEEEYLAITTFLIETNYAARGVPSPAFLATDLTTIAMHPAQTAASDAFSNAALRQTPYFLLPCLFTGCPSLP